MRTKGQGSWKGEVRVMERERGKSRKEGEGTAKRLLPPPLSQRTCFSSAVEYRLPFGRRSENKHLFCFTFVLWVATSGAGDRNGGDAETDNVVDDTGRQ